ncbi:MAG: lipocalin-like domain-containing protein, partial [Shewanella sp.]
MSARVYQTKAWRVNTLASATRFKLSTSAGFILKSVIGGLLLAAISGCDNAPSTTEPQSMGALLGQASADSQSFAKVTPGNRFQFPQDHLAHQDFRQEWWYLTANLTTENGEQLGAQWTQFRVALKPKHSESQNVGSNPKSTWTTEQLYFAHSALTSSTSHLAHEKWSRAHP